MIQKRMRNMRYPSCYKKKKMLKFFLQTPSDVKNIPKLSTQVHSTFQPLGHVSLI